jgi:hypothetical protein
MLLKMMRMTLFSLTTMLLLPLPLINALGQKGQEEGGGGVDTSPDLDDSGEGA